MLGLWYRIGMLRKSTAPYELSPDTDSLSDEGCDFSKSMDESDATGRTRWTCPFSVRTSLTMPVSYCPGGGPEKPAGNGGSAFADLVTKTCSTNRGSSLKLARWWANQVKYAANS